MVVLLLFVKIYWCLFAALLKSTAAATSYSLLLSVCLTLGLCLRQILVCICLVRLLLFVLSLRSSCWWSCFWVRSSCYVSCCLLESCFVLLFVVQNHASSVSIVAAAAASCWFLIFLSSSLGSSNSIQYYAY